MRSSLASLKNSEIFRNTAIMVSGTAVAQLIPILLQLIILRRSFSSDVFGAYGVYQSLLGILIVISSLRYEQAIVLPEKDNEAAALFFLSVILNFFFSFLIFIIFFIFNNEILFLLNLDPKFDVYILLTPVGIFLFGLFQSLNFWLVRKKGFAAISVTKIIRRGTEGTVQLFFVFFRDIHGLVYGDIIGHIANTFTGIRKAARRGLSTKQFSISKIIFVLKKYFDYPKYNLLPAFMETCSFLLPTLIITKFYSAENTGYFDLCKFVLSVPLALIATSLSNVLLQRVSEKNQLKLSIRNDLWNTLKVISLIVVLEIAVILLFGRELFILFGPEWEVSGNISKILVWSFAFNFLTSSFSSILISLKKIKLLSAFQVFYFAAIILLFLFNNLTFVQFLKVYVAIEVICSTVLSLLLLNVILRYEKSILTVSAFGDR